MLTRSTAVEVNLQVMAGSDQLFGGTFQVGTGARSGYVAGAPLYRPFILSFVMNFTQVGLHEFVLSDAKTGVQLHTVRLGVRLGVGPDS
jgi:hypothetical protein